MYITVTMVLHNTIIAKFVSVDSKMLIYITCYVLCELSLLPQWLVMVCSYQLSLCDVFIFCLVFLCLQQKVYEVKLEDGNVYVKHATRLSLQPFPAGPKS